MNWRRYRRGMLEDAIGTAEARGRLYWPWELSTAVLTVAYVTIGFADDQKINGLDVPILFYAPFVVVFLVEFLVRILDARERGHYLREHWLDLVTATPMIGGLRLLRLLRLLRFVVSMRRIFGARWMRAHEGDMWFVWPALVLFWVSSAYALWVFEHGVNPRVATFGDALLGSLVTATTIGYNDVSPVTTEGKVTAGLIVFFALGLLSFASSRVTTWWLGMQERDADDRVIDRLSLIEEQLRQTEALLLQIQKDLSSPAAAALDIAVARRVSPS